MTGEEAIQKRDIIVTQFINELGVTIETNTKPLIHCQDCIYWTKQSNSLQGRCAISGSYPTGAWYCANAVRRDDNATNE